MNEVFYVLYWILEINAQNLSKLVYYFGSLLSYVTIAYSLSTSYVCSTSLKEFLQRSEKIWAITDCLFAK